MRRVLLITLSLVFALVGWSTVGAEDGFYVIPVMKGKYAPVPKTGQTTPYGTGTDGALQKGVTSPTPRFTDNNNGTVTDKLTGLIWMKNTQFFPNGAYGYLTWTDALSNANGLKSGSAGLTDGSKAGDWRLPNLKEFQSLFDYGGFLPALSAGHPFTAPSTYYWSSTTNIGHAANAWVVKFDYGTIEDIDKTYNFYVQGLWCVRGGP